MNLDNIKKYLDFYVIHCKWEYDESCKYHGHIDHIIYPLEDIGFGKKVEDYSEITSINSIQLMFSFIPNKRYLRFMRKNTRSVSMWTSENIADTVLVEYDDITLDDYVLYIEEEKEFELTSEKLISEVHFVPLSETNKIGDVWIEKIIGNRPYVDMDKVIKKTNKILSGDLGFILDFESFMTLLDKGEIDGKRISRSNREYE